VIGKDIGEGYQCISKMNSIGKTKHLIEWAAGGMLAAVQGCIRASAHSPEGFLTCRKP
jgi:hypothetical protein